MEDVAGNARTIVSKLTVNVNHVKFSVTHSPGANRVDTKCQKLFLYPAKIIFACR